MGYTIDRAEIKTPGKLLDMTYTATCSCGKMWDFGYMAVTCDRETEAHIARGPEHNVEIIAAEAEPLTRSVMTQRLKVNRQRKDDSMQVGRSLRGSPLQTS
jgi:hypothetical protein